MKVFKDSAFSSYCGDDISYGFYGRTGGVSSGIYASLNCAPGSNDVPDAVAKNRSIVAKDMGVKDGMISSLWQCHSATCYAIKSYVGTGDARPKGDALVTDVAGLAIGILTADCGPVLFAGKKTDGSPVIGAYCISKAADAQLARNLAVEFGPSNVRVNCISPGLIKTDFARALWENPETSKRATSTTPLRRIGEPDEIAGAAVFLASSAGSYLTGQNIVVDGGATI